MQWSFLKRDYAKAAIKSGMHSSEIYEKKYISINCMPY